MASLVATLTTLSCTGDCWEANAARSSNSLGEPTLAAWIGYNIESALLPVEIVPVSPW